MSNSLTVWSLNGGRFVGKTPGEEPQALKWMKSLADPNTPIPDVLMLQDFRVSLLPYLSRLPHFHFAPMTNHLIWGKRELVGILIASQHPIKEGLRVEYTWRDGYIKDLQGVDDKNQRIKPDEVADRLVLETECRVAIVCTIRDIGFGTTHGFWVRGGVPTEKQMRSTEILAVFLRKDACGRGGLVLAADLNVDRENRVLGILEGIGGRDWLPSDIKTTVAATNPGAQFGAKPDRIMTFLNQSGRNPYDVTDVHTDDTPGSDHLMLCATVHRK